MEEKIRYMVGDLLKSSGRDNDYIDKASARCLTEVLAFPNWERELSDDIRLYLFIVTVLMTPPTEKFQPPVWENSFPADYPTAC